MFWWQLWFDCSITYHDDENYAYDDDDDDDNDEIYAYDDDQGERKRK